MGTGVGVLLPFILKHRPARVAACDLSGEMIKVAGQRFGDSVTLLQMDVMDIPPEQGPFGAVFCNAMFGNVYDQRQTIEAIGALLAPGGRLVISHPLGSDFVKRLKAGSPQYHLKELPDEAALNRLVDGTGLAVTHFVDETGSVPGRLHKSGRLASLALHTSRPLSKMYLCDSRAGRSQCRAWA